jgi:lipopolysaccharide transport system ATP-binding protein
MGAVQRLCTHVVWLQHGRLVGQGPTEQLVARYLADSGASSRPGQDVDLSGASRRGTQEARFVALRYTSNNPRTADRPYPDGPLDLTLRLASDRNRRVMSLAVSLYDRQGTQLVNADSRALGEPIYLHPGDNFVGVRIAGLHLKPGTYVLGLYLADPGHLYDRIDAAAPIEVVEPRAQGPGPRPPNDGCVTCDFAVSVEVPPDEFGGPTREAVRTSV